MADDGYYHKNDSNKPALVIIARCGLRVTKFHVKWSNVTCPACKRAAPPKIK
jgi:hypothetical protein